MDLKAVAMHQLIHDGGRQFRSIRIQLDSVSTDGVPPEISENAVPSPMHGSMAEYAEEGQHSQFLIRRASETGRGK
jgi:hypothetical protein